MKTNEYQPPTGTECSECYESATTGYSTFSRVVYLCEACKYDYDNYDGPPDREDGEPPITLEERYQAACRQKYYGEGL